MTNALPAEILEQRAAEQRRRIHNSVTELRASVNQKVRDRFDVKRNAREYLLPASGIAALLGLVFGYTVSGIFTD